MSTRKLKTKQPNSRAPVNPLADRLTSCETALQAAVSALFEQRKESAELKARVEILETRQHLRDKSQDEPVSNASEAIGQTTRVAHTPVWRRFLAFMGAA